MVLLELDLELDLDPELEDEELDANLLKALVAATFPLVNAALVLVSSSRVTLCLFEDPRSSFTLF